MSKFVCMVCGFTYDEEKGYPEKGIAPSTKWEELSSEWKCPTCTVPKSMFKGEEQTSERSQAVTENSSVEDLREMTDGEKAALLSNLARGCEKQYLGEEAAKFSKLADFFTANITLPSGDFDSVQEKIENDFGSLFPSAKDAAGKFSDRGAKRILTWTEKVSLMTQNLLKRYEKEGNAMLKNTKIWVCDICGFIFLGNAPTDICPVCKVPSFKILEVTK